MPNDPQDFAFTAGGGLSPASFSLDDDANATLSNTQTFTNVVPGCGYSLAETVPSGWDQTQCHVRRRQPGVEHRRRPGRDRHLHLGEHQAGQRSRSTKDAVPNDPQDFAFTAGGGLSPASFSLDDDCDPARCPTPHVRERRCPAAATRSRRPCRAAGTRRAPPATTAARCRTSTSSPGENVTCTFTNRKRGRIVVVKDAPPNDPQDFASRPAAGSPRRSFSSTTTPTRRCRTRRRSRTWLPAAATRVAETVPVRLGPVLGDL